MDTDVLLYLDNRFDSVQKKQDEVNTRLFEKLEAIHTQTLKTNGRVNSLEKLQSECPGKEALSKIKDSNIEQKTKETNEYKLGNLLITSSIAASIVLTIIAIYKHIL